MKEQINKFQSTRSLQLCSEKTFRPENFGPGFGVLVVISLFSS